jgi:hypothetical protein
MAEGVEWHVMDRNHYKQKCRSIKHLLGTGENNRTHREKGQTGEDHKVLAKNTISWVKRPFLLCLWYLQSLMFKHLELYLFHISLSNVQLISKLFWFALHNTSSICPFCSCHFASFRLLDSVYQLAISKTASCLIYWQNAPIIFSLNVEISDFLPIIWESKKFLTCHGKRCLF